MVVHGTVKNKGTSARDVRIELQARNLPATACSTCGTRTILLPGLAAGESSIWQWYIDGAAADTRARVTGVSGTPIASPFQWPVSAAVVGYTPVACGSVPNCRTAVQGTATNNHPVATLKIGTQLLADNGEVMYAWAGLVAPGATVSWDQPGLTYSPIASAKIVRIVALAP